MMSFACSNLDHYSFEEELGKKNLSKTISGNSTDSSSFYNDNNMSMSPEKKNNSAGAGSRDGDPLGTIKSAPPKFVFKKDL